MAFLLDMFVEFSFKDILPPKYQIYNSQNLKVTTFNMLPF